ncbi:S-adenosylmethionine:tRNA ribosyltransferase-isomerase [Sandaracinomonas limnophila]|uniref:S-adenosylmethionine:tRNA ribosyltransferase-isomerase n=1 Tax=Sandaracinomonas limnophila TaxID=1862386 RepID=A0A437PQR5_9BACT|nr:S-adenosylmethionine:tRNA ribosyltransferase-isomerase [Sandaracinomonas limnophila]RVU24596.1 S-adenosylmethionine:tRNA ribosyltransferase-isomerase [Sandaracinomonas limnophila]
MKKILMPEVWINEYDYPLPDEQIAQNPLAQRDSSRLLVFQNQQIVHKNFSDLADFIPENSMMIFNDTKVIPARIFVQKSSGAHIELFLLRPNVHQNLTEVLEMTESSMIWEVMVGNKKRWKLAEVLQKEILVGGQKNAVKFSWVDREMNWVEISWEGKFTMEVILEQIGNTPLPPYMQRDSTIEDQTRYQTIFSKAIGAVAAPTASLHFSEKTFQNLNQKNVNKQYLTLHVGAGTFLPVKEENVSKHPMHREQIIVSAEFIKNLLAHQGKFIPVGTTALRALESLYWSGVYLLQENNSVEFPVLISKEFAYQEQEQISCQQSLENILNYLQLKGMGNWVVETELLIMPGYQFRFCDALVTNFHQPKSTLLVLVSALVGSHWKDIYQNALDENYRFLSYGDSSLLFNQNMPKFT